jgi:methyl-CpG-binding domain protein 4
MPHAQLLQERFRSDPWKLLVACVLLNQTARRQVDRVIDELFRLWPSAHAMAAADEVELSELLRPLGLYKRRASILIRLSRRWVDWRLDHDVPDGSDVMELPGVGKYASDSYRLFVLRDDSIEPEDKELRAYMERRMSATYRDSLM